ncbi:MAG: DUF4870 domain-containing protein [Leptolyngbya sp. SIO1E4]|nr:DUF4870 domain-containing protein [Leptolyngbya sp. SIO1E4]
MTQFSNLQKRKLLSTLCHLSTFLNWFIIPLIVPIIVLCISDDEITQKNATEAINFYISFIFYYTLFLISIFSLIGLVFLPFVIPLIIADYLLPIIAIVHCSTHLNKAYRYPFIIRIV